MGTNSFVNLPTLGVGYAATVLAASPTELSSFVTLGPLTEGGYADGQLAYVETTGLTYVIRPTVGPTDGINVIATSDDPTRQWVATNSQVATWNINNVRVYAVDFVNGNDMNVGFADAASSSAGDYAAACQLAGSRAMKTYAGLAAIFPKVGNGRKVEVVMANGGVNIVEAYVGGLDSFMGGSAEYAAFDMRATGTNPTAGCVAFDGSIADCTYLGAVTGTGMNVSGYVPTGVPTTSVVTCTLNGGGAPGFPTELAIPAGLRIRFDSGSATQAALRNVCRHVVKVSGGNTLTWTLALPAVPLATDVFYIEQCGVTYDSTTIGDSNPSKGTPFQIAGIACTGVTFSTSLSTINFAFTQHVNLTSVNDIQHNLNQLFTHPVLGGINVGGTRQTGSISTSNDSIVNHTNWVCTGSNVTHSNPTSATFTNGWASAAALTVITPTQITFGNTTTPVGTTGRIVGGGTNFGLFLGNNFGPQPGAASIQQIDISNTIGSAIIIRAEGMIIDLGAQDTSASAITGTGNAQWGLILSEAKNCIIYINGNNPPTVTGLIGDVFTSDGRTLTWAQVVNNGYGIVDGAGNRIIVGFSTSSNYNSIRTTRLKFSGTLFGAGGAVFTYLADGGDALVANNVTPLGYGTTGLSLSEVFINPRVNTMTHACTATLYKNGSAVGTPVSIPAGSTTQIKTNWGVFVTFLYGDEFDIRLDDPSADAGHTLAVSVTTEGP